MKIYTPNQIDAMSGQAVKEAFQHLKSVANKRIGRMQAQGLGRSDMRKFGSMRGMSEEQMRQGLADVSRWIRDPAHTVKGYKTKRSEFLDAMHEKGFDFVNEENYEDFVDFMEDLREEYGSKVFDSGAAADVFSNTQRIGISPEIVKKNFDYFAEHMDELDRMKPIRSEKGGTMRAIKDKIRKLEE